MLDLTSAPSGEHSSSTCVRSPCSCQRWNARECSPRCRPSRAPGPPDLGRDTGGTIPSFKIATNDGWHVTPAEVRRALGAYREHVELAGEPLLDVAEVHDADELGAAARRSTRARI
jgi:hypothetical protein